MTILNVVYKWLALALLAFGLFTFYLGTQNAVEASALVVEDTEC